MILTYIFLSHMSSLSREILHIYNYDNTLKTTSLNKRQTLYKLNAFYIFYIVFDNTHSALIIAMILLAKYKRGKYCFEQDSYV